MPAVSSESLIVIGTPCRGPRRRAVGDAGLGQSRISANLHDGVQLRVDGFNPIKEGAGNRLA